MKYFFAFAFIFVLAGISDTTAQVQTNQNQPTVTGLEGWSIFLDPGHSRRENMGLYNYSEAEKVLRVGLFLRDMLLTQTDIDTVFITRTNDEQSVGLTQRTQMANATGADFYYSIHSDAGPPNVNSTLMLWGANGLGVEKFPRGGKKMGDIMDVDLTASMRIPSRGSRADSPFYGAPTTRTEPWLAVNRLTNMASVLSEAGFHTNPTQQMRNMNNEWRKLEAQSAFWSILAYHDIARPPVGIITGFIRNDENNALLNGAKVTIGDNEYITDSFESLFSQFVSDPELLANGFYYLEDFEPGSSQTVMVVAEGFYPATREVSVRDNFFTFADVNLISSVPPTVTGTIPAAGSEGHNQNDAVVITFSRRVLESSLQGQISISPEVDFSYRLVNGHELRLTAPEMDYLTDYTITLGTQIEDLAGHLFDGNADGIEGGTYFFTFKTRERDTFPPVVTSVFPAGEQPVTDRNPIISFTLNEIVDPGSVTNEQVLLLPADGGPAISVKVNLYTVGDKSVIQANPTEILSPGGTYRAVLQPGIADMSDNATTESNEFTFSTESLEFQYSTIDAFNAGISNWWVPQQSGSTAGIVTELTSREAESMIVNPVTNSRGAMAMNYGWDLSAGTHLIRNYLPPTALQNNIRFTSSAALEVYLFGDGSGNRFRFMARDGNSQLEGSPWYTVNWIGWRLIRWDLSKTPAVGWVNGDGVVNGTAYTDSFQMTYSNGAATTGSFIVDDYRVARGTAVTSVPGAPDVLPDRIALGTNYPNPFNPQTTIQFELPQSMDITLRVYDLTGRQVAVLAQGNWAAGSHSVQFNAAYLASGMYLYRLGTPEGILTGKMMLVK
jgi:N-acetylmuramoyl-L-alanine amidase